MILRVAQIFSAYLPRRLELLRRVMIGQAVSCVVSIGASMMGFSIHVRGTQGQDPKIDDPYHGFRFIAFSVFGLHFLVSCTYLAFIYTLRKTYLSLGEKLLARAEIQLDDDEIRRKDEIDPELADNNISLREPQAAAPAVVFRPLRDPKPLQEPSQPLFYDEEPKSMDQLQAIARAQIEAENMHRSEWPSSPSLTSSTTSETRGETFGTSSWPAPIGSFGSQNAQNAEDSQAIFGALERQFPVGSADLMHENIE